MRKTLQNINLKVVGATEKEIGVGVKSGGATEGKTGVSGSATEKVAGVSGFVDGVGASEGGVRGKREKLYEQVKSEIRQEKVRGRGGTVKRVIWGTLAVIGAIGMCLPTSAATTPIRNAAPYLENVVTELIITEVDVTNNTFSVVIEENGKTSPLVNWDYKWLYVNDGAGTSDDALSGMTNRRGDWVTVYSRSSQTEPLEKGVEAKLNAIVGLDDETEPHTPTLSQLSTQEISYVMRITQTLEDGTNIGWYTVGRYNYSSCYEGLTDTTGVVCRAERYTSDEGVEMVRYYPIMPEGDNTGDSGDSEGGSESGGSGDSEGSGSVSGEEEGSGGSSENGDDTGDTGDAGSENSGSDDGSGSSDDSEESESGSEEGSSDDDESSEPMVITKVIEKVVEKTYEIVRAVTNEVPGATRVQYVYSTLASGANSAATTGVDVSADDAEAKKDNETGLSDNWGSENVVKNNETEVEVPALGGQKEEKSWIMPTIIGILIGAGAMGITWWLFGARRRKEEEEE